MAVPKAMGLPFDPIERAAAIWERRFGDSKAMAAATSVMRVHQILLGELDALLRPFGLTFARYEALVLLSFSRTGALPLRLIGERLMVHPTSVTNTIDRLERSKFVVRRPNPQDKRGTLAEITPAGRDVVGRATSDLMAAGFGMRDYDAGELDALFSLLRTLRVSAGDFAEPAGDGAEPAGDGAEPAGDGAEPAGDGAEPAGDFAEPAGMGAEPAGDFAESVGGLLADDPRLPGLPAVGGREDLA